MNSSGEPTAADPGGLTILGRSIEHAPEETFVLSGDGRILLTNRKARLLLAGATPARLADAVVTTAEDTRRLLALIRRTATPIPFALELPAGRTPFLGWRIDGGAAPAETLLFLRADPVLRSMGRFITLKAEAETARDRLTFTEEQHRRLRQEAARLKEQARRDPLTGLLNSAEFDRAVLRDLRSGRDGALFFLDLDGFKPINDHFGHDAGDQILRKVARRLALQAAPDGIVARLGGDEFGVWSADLSEAEAADLALSFKSDIARPVPWEDAGRAVSLQVGASVGFAHSGQNGVNHRDLRLLADQRMYLDKAARSAERLRA